MTRDHKRLYPYFVIDVAPLRAYSSFPIDSLPFWSLIANDDVSALRRTGTGVQAKLPIKGAPVSKQFLSMLAVACAVLGAHAFSGADAASPALSITHGVASGDVTATTAVIWVRASGPARMYVEVDTDPIFSKSKKVKKERVR
jgi:hypothetical protein